DNYSNSSPRNLDEFAGHPRLTVVEGSVENGRLLDGVWQKHGPFDTVLHLAAQIRVQDSIDNPVATFQSDVVGTLEVLERCRKQYFQENGLSVDQPFHLLDVESRLKKLRPRMVLMSTCMVYSRANDAGISESHPV